MDWKPVCPKKEKAEAVDVDPGNTDLVVIKIPLNKNPNLEWEYFFENPKGFKGPIYSQKVRGNQVLLKAKKDSPVEAVKQVFDYIKSANKRYREFIEDQKDRYVDLEEKELEKITEKIRDI